MVRGYFANSALEQGYWALRLVYFIGPFVAGADKFVHWLVDWNKYLSPVFAGLLPMGPGAFMTYIVGPVEMIVGLLVLFGVTRIGGYLASLWLAGIVVNLLSMGLLYGDIALRDIGLCLGAFALAKLTEARMAQRTVVTETDVVYRDDRLAA
jgi:uncharacterized membrane protein YphA (DoxX/SURF4 family)